jgi:ribosomal protein S18 acetylase RimI-like enzyme
MLTIRYGIPDDVPFIVECQLKMALETEQLELDQTTVTKGVEAVFKDPAKGFYIVGSTNDTKVSCLMITKEWSDWRNAWVWWIQSVFVKPEFRQSGIFGMMYDNIKDLVMENGSVPGIRLYVDKSNTRAQDVYRKVGMNGEHYSTFEWMK